MGTNAEFFGVEKSEWDTLSIGLRKSAEGERTMEDPRLSKLLSLLKTNEYRTSAQLAAELGLGERTTRKLLHTLRDRLANSGAKVESRTHHGYRLKVENSGAFERTAAQLGSPLGANPQTAAERMDYLISYLLFCNEYIKKDDLCDILYVSSTTLSAALKSAEELFSQYGLTIERRPNYGMRAHGPETNIRRLLCDHFLKQRRCTYVLGMDHEQELSWLASLIKDLVARLVLNLSELAFENFVDWCYVSLVRMQAGFFASLPLLEHAKADGREKRFVDELTTHLEAKYGIAYTPDEKRLLLLRLASRRIAGTQAESTNFVMRDEITRLATKMLELVSTDYHLNLMSDFDLRMSLIQHLTPMDVRMRFDLPVSNPLLDEVKKNYPLAFQMATLACGVLAEHYGRKIPQDEIAFIALILELGLERDRSPVTFDLLLVCDAERSNSQLLKLKLQHQFADWINHIYTSSSHDLPTFDFSKVDYVLTTAPIATSIPKPILEVGPFLEKSDIARLSSVLATSVDSSSVTERYIGRARFITGDLGRTKSEVLQSLCGHITRHEDVDDNFYNLVVEREKLPQVELGNGIALPHPNAIASNRSFAYVAVLTAPVVWTTRETSVVALISIGRNDHDEESRRKLYEALAAFALDSSAVRTLVSSPTYATLETLLKAH